MGYRVDYTRSEKKERRLWRKLTMAVLTAAVLVLWLWPQAREYIRDILIPGDAAVTTAALEELARELRGGQGLLDSLELFVHRILEGAGHALA